MNVDALCNIVADPTEFVILTGVGVNGKPYRMFKLDNQRGFDIGKNDLAIKRLLAVGVRTVSPKPVEATQPAVAGKF